MEGIEIVITPRTIERFILGLIIVILTVLLIVNLGDNCDVSTDTSSTNVNLQEETPVVNTTNTTSTATTTSASSCENGVKDSDETDVDCGGSCSANCAEFKACNLDADCTTGLYCSQHIKCLAPTCDDGVKNQGETNIDCGGVCGGYYWVSDKTCHDTKEPSGVLEVTLSANIGRSPNSGSAIIEDVTYNLNNGLGKDLSMTVDLYARDEDGDPIFENKEGEIAVYSGSITLKDEATLKKKIDFTNNTRSILAGIKSTDSFQIVAEFKDSVKKTAIEEAVWVNGK